MKCIALRPLLESALLNCSSWIYFYTDLKFRVSVFLYFWLIILPDRSLSLCSRASSRSSMLQSGMMPLTPPATPPDYGMGSQCYEDPCSTGLTSCPDALEMYSPTQSAWSRSPPITWCPEVPTLSQPSLQNHFVADLGIHQKTHHYTTGYQDAQIPTAPWTGHLAHPNTAEAGLWPAESFGSSSIIPMNVMPEYQALSHDLHIEHLAVSPVPTMPTRAFEQLRPTVSRPDGMLPSVVAGSPSRNASFVPYGEAIDLSQVGDQNVGNPGLDKPKKWEYVPRQRQRRRHRAMNGVQWQCEECGTLFERAHNRTKHMATHGPRDKPYACDVEGCTQAPFARLNDLERHKKTASIDAHPCCTLLNKFRNTVKQSSGNAIAAHTKPIVAIRSKGLLKHWYDEASVLI